jgi:hypothetical protein
LVAGFLRQFGILIESWNLIIPRKEWRIKWKMACGLEVLSFFWYYLSH